VFDYNLPINFVIQMSLLYQQLMMDENGVLGD